MLNSVQEQYEAAYQSEKSSEAATNYLISDGGNTPHLTWKPGPQLFHTHHSHFPLADRLTRRWVDFGRLLRRNGVAVTAGQVRDLLRALPLLDLKDRNEIYFASRAMLCARKEDLPRFDLTFRQFWARTRTPSSRRIQGRLRSDVQPATSDD